MLLLSKTCSIYQVRIKTNCVNGFCLLFNVFVELYETLILDVQFVDSFVFNSTFRQLLLTSSGFHYQ